MAQVTRRVAAAVPAMLAVALLLVGAGSTVAAAQTPAEAGLAGEVASFVNAERQARGLAPLEVEPVLAQRAQAHAQDLAAAGAVDVSDVVETGVAEAVGRAPAGQTTGSAVRALVLVEAQRLVLLHDQASTMGVGVACAAAGDLYVVVARRATGRPVSLPAPEPVVTGAEAGSSCPPPVEAPPTTVQVLGTAPPVPTTPATVAPPSTQPVATDGDGTGAAGGSRPAWPIAAAVAFVTIVFVLLTWPRRQDAEERVRLRAASRPSQWLLTDGAAAVLPDGDEGLDIGPGPPSWRRASATQPTRSTRAGRRRHRAGDTTSWRIDDEPPAADAADGATATPAGDPAAGAAGAPGDASDPRPRPDAGAGPPAPWRPPPRPAPPVLPAAPPVRATALERRIRRALPDLSATSPAGPEAGPGPDAAGGDRAAADQAGPAGAPGARRPREAPGWRRSPDGGDPAEPTRRPGTWPRRGGPADGAQPGTAPPPS